MHLVVYSPGATLVIFLLSKWFYSCVPVHRCRVAIVLALKPKFKFYSSYGTSYEHRRIPSGRGSGITLSTLPQGFLARGSHVATPKLKAT